MSLFSTLLDRQSYSESARRAGRHRTRQRSLVSAYQPGLEELERRELLAATLLAEIAPGLVLANEPPVANNDLYGAVEDSPLVIAAPGVLANDTDPNNYDLSAIVVDNSAHGTLSLNLDGSFSYTPSANFFGTDTFTYQASDGQSGSDIASVTINFTPVNDAPFGTNGTVTAAEDTLYTFNVADFGFSDPLDAPPNSFLAVRLTTLPAAGTLTVGGVPMFLP